MMISAFFAPAPPVSATGRGRARRFGRGAVPLCRCSAPGVDPLDYDPPLGEGVEPSMLQELRIAQTRVVLDRMSKKEIVEAYVKVCRQSVRQRNWIFRAIDPDAYEKWRREASASE